MAALAACWVFAFFLAKLPAYGFLQNRGGRNQTLDGLRGFLALIVCFHHVCLTYYWKTTGTWEIPDNAVYNNFGKVGVAVFFMITGYLFTAKLLKDGAHPNWARLYESRLFRIMPLYLLAVLIISIVVFSLEPHIHVPAVTLARDYLKWFLFHGGTINDFEETRRVIAGVDWSLKYEWVFYFSLPIIALGMRIAGGWWLAALAAGSIALFVFPLHTGSFTSVYAVLFSVGGVAAFGLHASPSLQGHKLVTSPIASILALAAIAVALLEADTMSAVQVIGVSVFFWIVVFGNDLFGLLKTLPAILLGEISYSLYLLHGAVLYCVFSIWQPIDINSWSSDEFGFVLPLVALLVVAVSATTFSLVEHPFIVWGSKKPITSRLNRAAKTVERSES